jgi:hypothetical protein
MSLVNSVEMPGPSAVLSESQRRLVRGYPSSLILHGVAIASATVDAGNTPTTELRAGLLMGKIAATGLFKQYDPTATDGSQYPIGPLYEERNMLNAAGTAQQVTGRIVIGGYLVASQVINLDARARQMLYGRIIFDDMIPGAAPGWFGPVVKTADYTLVAADSGYCFTTRGAAGAVIFDLPTTIPAGFRALFKNEADQNMTVRCTSKLVALHNLTATSVAFSTSSQKIGGGIEVIANDNQTKYHVINQSAGANTITVA